MKFISSIHNSEIRQIEHWNRKSRNRRRDGIFVLEGQRELRLALSGGYRPEKIYFCPEIMDEATLDGLIGNSECPRISLSSEVYRHLAYRGNN